MSRSIMSPAKYIQGRGEIRRLSRYCGEAGGTRAYVIADAFVVSNYENNIISGFLENDFPYQLHPFTGECSQREVQAIADTMREIGSDIIVGIGGGKTLDVAKAVGYYAGLPLIVVPTVASTDAPCSAISVLYTDDGRMDRYLQLRTNPNLVVVDTELVAKAPVRLLVAGMGDALSTFYEARACRRAAEAQKKDTSAIAAYALAQACRDTLLSYGLQAKLDAENGVLSEAVENIIEANIYLSGIGFESGGLAAAHAIHNAMTGLEETRPILHGEKVAFGTLVQLVLEKAETAEIQEAIAFCQRVGLPTTLKQLHLDRADMGRLRLLAEGSCAETEPMHNMPFQVKPEGVLEALLEADRLGTVITD
ncbi:glycerol dehydrogenase [Paenibacillus stellifer]|uniref:Glycerol dehydrogenase n=1 Tax=Paenibacillus stellifer TaxID=169760 RepID=A0A089LW95_9BACL|nr:glycerol dehydrogenase [Paenibacillus stellifer]AIQ65806.1 glycerol dehydrogenase [Paenibacillus stellifer]